MQMLLFVIYLSICLWHPEQMVAAGQDNKSGCTRTNIRSSPVVQKHPDKDNSETEQSLVLYLRTLFEDKDTQYIAAFPDLKGDGTLIAVVYVISDEVCGSGGCNTLILRRTGSSWKPVTTITITNLPIRVLNTRSYGWHDISVGVKGHNDAALRFNGSRYPSNPTVPPARPVKGSPSGEVLMQDYRQAKPLYSERYKTAPVK